jgi:hypothetical protein
MCLPLGLETIWGSQGSMKMAILNLAHSAAITLETKIAIAQVLK